MPSTSTLPVINVVTTCTSRKSAQPHPQLLMRNIAEDSVGARAEAWIGRLTANRHHTVRVADLYQGDHWSTIRRLMCAAKLQRREVNVWVASAGCGLLSTDTSVPAYSATFAIGDQDAVVWNSEERSQWWSLLRDKLAFLQQPLRSIAAIASFYPESPLIVAGSAGYLDAMSHDLVTAKNALCDPDHLTILCRKGAIPRPLASSAVRVSADLASVLGGALISLNARVLKWLILERPGHSDHKAIERAVAELRQTTAERKIPLRKKSTDQEIRQFITNHLPENRNNSATVLLHHFRISGRAAEQKRFQRIFSTVTEEAHLG